MSPHEPPQIDQSFVPPPAPQPGRDWPAPTRTAYPMKPTDSLLGDGRLFSGALGRVKINQHEHRVVVEWRDGTWVVVRPRLRPLGRRPSPLHDAVVSFFTATGLDADQLWGALRRPQVSPARPHVPLETDMEAGLGDDPGLVDQIVVGDPGEVVVTLLSDGSVEIAEFAVQWFGPATPQAYRRSDGRRVIRMGAGGQEATAAAVEAIREVRKVRRARYRRCVACRRATPPEWWHGKGYCQRCAERDLGVVH